MNDTPRPQFSALIVLPDDQEPVPVLGKDYTQRQLEFALAAGVDRIILLGNGGSGSAIALRHSAEKAAVKVIAASGAHALAALSRAAGRMLVFQPSIIPTSEDAMAALSEGECIVTCPAGIGSELGFERIDLARSWGGALTIDEDRVSGLLSLPADIEAPPALLRIALQSGVPEHSVEERELFSGQWALLHGEQDASNLEEKWVEGQQDSARGVLSGWLGNLAATHWLRRRAPHERHVAAVGVLCLLAAFLAPLAAWQGYAAGSFAVAALAPLLLELWRSLENWRRFPFGKKMRLAPALLAIDVSIALCGFFAIEWIWHERVFPPLVLLIALYLPARDRLFGSKVLRDRALLAGLLAIAALGGLAVQAIMVVSLLILACGLPVFRRSGH